MKMLNSRTVRAAIASVALAVVVGGAAVASTQTDRGTSRARITVCVGAKLDHLRLVPNGTTRCGKGETLLSWQTTGKRGAKGDGGPSAFEIATAAGFSGTEQQWLTSLHGQ